MPFKIGHSFEIAPIGPRFVHWPRANSKYNNGIPQNIITKKYGIKNIPKSKSNFEEQLSLLLENIPKIKII